MKTRLATLLICAALLLGCKAGSGAALEGSAAASLPTVTSVEESLISEDHTAEGFLVTLEGGDILHFFRLDPGPEGNHVGNRGRIVKRVSVNGGQSWSQPVTVYDSQYDDRNVHGGLTEEGRIVLFFRRYDASRPFAERPLDLNVIWSDDGGQSWSAPQAIVAGPTGSAGTHKLIHVPTRGYLGVVNGHYYLELRFSADGSDWSEVGQVWDYRDTQRFYLNEACFAYVGEGRLIGLIRDNSEAHGATYYQVSSRDFGQTWTEPERTNIASPFFAPSPQLFYDEERDDLWVVATDRRDYCGDFDPADAQVWIYRNRPEEVIDRPGNYRLFHRFPRPEPLGHTFYGYPTCTKTSAGNYLVIFTDAYIKENGREGANFYQFEILYE